MPRQRLKIISAQKPGSSSVKFIYPIGEIIPGNRCNPKYKIGVIKYTYAIFKTLQGKLFVCV